MRYEITIRGIRPIIMHNGAAGLDTRSPANLEKAEISRKKGSNRTVTDDARIRELECQLSLWLDEAGKATIPADALRATIERGARKLKQGPQVREGFIVEDVGEFAYDHERYGSTVEELGRKAQFTVGVVVQKNRILRTRARFDDWSCTFTVEVDPELIDKSQLLTWLDIAGRRCGLGDWRPEKSGNFGRFEVSDIKQLD